MDILRDIQRSPSGKFGLIFGVFLLVLPILTTVFGVSFYLDLATRFVILAIAAVSLNLILGYGGMVSFGHAAFLGIGAYAVGIPAYYDIASGWLHFPLAMLAGAVFALITGAISLRTKGVHFIMITMAFSQMVFFLFVSIEEYGGDDGLTIWNVSEFSSLLDVSNDIHQYYLCLASLALAVYLVRRLIGSRFGRVIEGSKSNERRMQAMGFATYRYRLTCYVISGAICGYAGALLGNYTEFISPEMMDWTRSGELIFMVVLGGTATLLGPVYGVAAFLLIEEFLPRVLDMIHEDLGIYWHIFFGVGLILVVLFVRGGISGLLNRRRDA